MNEQDIVDMYINQHMSTYAIAEKYETYPNKIRRILKKLNIELNDKSEAQRIAIKSGRSQHPTEGKERGPEVKQKISEASINPGRKFLKKKGKIELTNHASSGII